MVTDTTFSAPPSFVEDGLHGSNSNTEREDTGVTIAIMSNTNKNINGDNGNKLDSFELDDAKATSRLPQLTMKHIMDDDEEADFAPGNGVKLAEQHDLAKRLKRMQPINKRGYQWYPMILCMASLFIVALLVGHNTRIDISLPLLQNDLLISNSENIKQSSPMVPNNSPLQRRSLTTSVQVENMMQARPIKCNRVVRGTTSDETPTLVKPDCPEFNVLATKSRGVWYKLPGLGDGSCATLSTCHEGTNFDTRIRAYRLPAGDVISDTTDSTSSSEIEEKALVENMICVAASDDNNDRYHEMAGDTGCSEMTEASLHRKRVS